MRRFWLGTLGLAVVTAAAMVATRPIPSFGAPLWHHHLGLALTVVAGGLAWGALRHRRVITLAMAGSGLVATVTGFVMLLTRDIALKEWWTWWHTFSSFAFTLAFLAHWWRNNPRLWGFTGRLFARGSRAGYAATGAWLAALGAGVWTALPAGRVLITRENYVLVSLWTIIALVGIAYAVWLAYRLPALRARLADAYHRNRARAVVDTSLFVANWGALLTGFALLYLAGPLRDGPLKYPSKWWHTATSVAFLALLAIHIGFNARLVAAHARRVDGDLAGAAGRNL